MSWGPKHHVGRWDSNQTETWLLSLALSPGAAHAQPVHNAPKTRPAPAWIVRLLVGIAAVHIEEPASDREKRESPWKGSAVCCSGPHWQCQQRGVASARNTHCAPRRRSRTLRQTCPIRSPPVAAPRRRCPRDAHEKARSHGCHSDRPRDERNDERGGTRTRMRERMHGAAPTAPPTCAKVSEGCVSARARGVAHPLCSSSVSL